MKRNRDHLNKAFFSLLLFLSACGIKANPEVLKEPEVVVKRIGDKVYVKSLSGDIKIKDFEREGEYWIKERSEAFCFFIERVGGKGKKYCVGKSLQEKPALEILEKEEYVRLLAYGFENYKLYSIKDGILLLESGEEFKNTKEIKRDYWERCYAVTGIKNSSESAFVNFCVKPKKAPPVEDVKRLEIRQSQEKLYLVWFYDKEYREFVVYMNGEEIGRTVGFVFEMPIPKEKVIFTVKVIGPLGFESGGISVVYNP